jgi:alkaline phosphatase D
MNDILSQLGDIPPEVQQLPLFFDSLVKAATQRNDIDSSLVFSRMAEHGIVIVEVNENEMLVDFHNIPGKVDGIETAKENYYHRSDEYFSKVRLYQFKVSNGQLIRLT